MHLIVRRGDQHRCHRRLQEDVDRLVEHGLRHVFECPELSWPRWPHTPRERLVRGHPRLREGDKTQSAIIVHCRLLFLPLLLRILHPRPFLQCGHQFGDKMPRDGPYHPRLLDPREVVEGRAHEREAQLAEKNRWGVAELDGKDFVFAFGESGREDVPGFAALALLFFVREHGLAVGCVRVHVEEEDTV